MTTVFDDCHTCGAKPDVFCACSGHSEHYTPMTPELRAMFDKLPLPEDEYLLWLVEMRAIHERNGH